MAGTVVARVVDGQTLSQRDLDETYAVRARAMALKETTDPQKDRAYFEHAVRNSNLCAVLRVDEAIVGFTAAELRPYQHEDRSAWVLEFHFGFVDRAYRGRSSYVMSLLLRLAAMTLRRPSYPLYTYGTAYLPSFLKIAALGDVLCYQPGHAPDWEHRLLHRLCHERDGAIVDRSTGLAHLPTVPRDSTRKPSSRVLVDAAQRYLALNPKWTEGYALPVLMRVRPMEFMVKTARQRAVRLVSGSANMRGRRAGEQTRG